MFRHRLCNTFIRRYYRSTTSVLSNTPLAQHKPTYYVSTPIFYVNDVPHIGHLYSAVLGDAIARWKRTHDYDVLYSTGTDEHGLKVQQAAANRKCQPKEHCDKFSNSFRTLFEFANISHNDFIRTTEGRHHSTVEQVWRSLQEKGYIYKGSYEGWYCMSDEAFLTDSNVTDGVDPKSGASVKVSKESGHTVEWMSEENYMFRLSEMKPQLLKWLEKHPVKPEPFDRVVRHLLDEGLKDLSVSRPRDRLSWGIPVPDDQSQTIYVWLDALVNYLTVAGPKYWPADCHIVGKDILRFHAIYWPAFLLAAEMPPPKSILVHSHWTVEYQKMSKSLGNVVDPYKEIERFTVDGLRYFLLKNGVPHSDGSYVSEEVKRVINSDLVNTLGNLLNRCSGTALNPKQMFPPLNKALFEQRTDPEFREILTNLHNLQGLVDGHYENYQIYKALECIMDQLRDANGFFHAHAPWTLKDKEEEREWMDSILHIGLANVYVTGKLLAPVIPNIAAKILSRLGVANCIDIHSYSGPLGQNEGVLMKRLN
jgi:methionyl-tRNA synthetase